MSLSVYTLVLACLMLTSLSASAVPAVPPELVWSELKVDDVEGHGWKETGSPYDRLPAVAEKTVPPAVWGLSHHSAGICFHFKSSSPRIGVRWVLRNESLAMPHMPATGVSGVDLYVRKEKGDWRFLTCGQPKVFPLNELVTTVGKSEMREYRLYLPLYNGVTSVSLGLEPGNTVEIVRDYPAERQKGIVFYGTSITQGACASRPGMAFTAIVGRRLNTPIVNLGFSGNGKMEPALADLLCELQPDMYVLDCLRNMSVEQVRERVEPFILRLRQARPNTPIVLLEDAFIENPAETPRGKIVQEVVARLTKQGTKNLYYVPMREALGTDGEGTVDTVHPNDLGMMRQAETVIAALQRIPPFAQGIPPAPPK